MAVENSLQHKTGTTILLKSAGGTGSIKANDLKPGHKVSMDEYESKVKRRLYHSTERLSLRVLWKLTLHSSCKK